MEPESQMGPARFRAYNWLGLVLGVVLVVVGILALLLGGGPVLGWVMIGGGLVAIVAGVFQLRRA